MTRGEAWSVHISNLLVGGTGVVYAWMLYVTEPSDPFSVVNHPWQPTLQQLHVLVAPLLVFAAGLIWRDHIWKHFKNGNSRRRSGLGLLLTLVPMVVSGYLIQTSVDPTWRKIWVGVHLTTAALWVLAYLGHYVAGRKQARAKRRAAARAESLRQVATSP